MKKATAPKSTMSLFNAFNIILSKAHGSELCDQFYADTKKEMKYLGDTLQLSPIQCTLLSIILERSANGVTDIDDISNFLDTSNMTILTYSDDLTLLKERHLIRESCNMRGISGYIVPQEVIDCFKRNENFVYKPSVCKNNSDLYNEMDVLVSLCSDHDMNARDCYNEIVALLKQNSEIPMATCLLKCHDILTETEFRVLIGVAMYWIRHNDDDVQMNMVSFLLDSRRHVNSIASEMSAGTSPLIRRKLIKLSNDGGMGVRNSFCLTSQFKKKLYPEICTKSTPLNQDSHLKSHNTLVAKPMFYNPGEAEQVSRLHHLLKPENMTSILKRLNDRKMRGGFSILLYGGPGTGKTETVNQLAKESGRALFVVEMDQMRSKWYGESERLVKKLFDDYRKCVETSSIAPILFFNEADALFNRRMENAVRSVDKGENALQNIILQEMENLNGILIATTNLATSLDPAFERRFIYKLELKKPQQQVKAKIWRSMLPCLTEKEAETLSMRYDFSGGQIENIMRKGTVEEILTGNTMTFDQWCMFCDQELINTSKAKRPIGFHGA